MNYVPPVDYIFPFVDPSKKQWREEYINYCKQTGNLEKIAELSGERFRDFGWLKFVFRGIAQNLPFIRDLYLIVSGKDQVPAWVNTNMVKIIVHEEFIPKKYLPTYNSATIECFLPNIKTLSDYFIYGNDDMFCINRLKFDDFFTQDGKTKMPFYIHPNGTRSESYFWRMCQNEYWTIVDLVHASNSVPPQQFIMPDHDVSPLNKKLCLQCLKLLNTKVSNSISAFRTDQNYQQYAYHIHALLNGSVDPSPRKFRLFNMGGNSAEGLADFIKNSDTQILCLNDNECTDGAYWMQNANLIYNAFLEKMPNKCKYEK